jgi:2-succinyl-5-enolpyruvyl-6-hydroxy-3-cyclohexene-1-carboxylate synthase
MRWTARSSRRCWDVTKAAELFELPDRKVEALSELADALADDTGLIEIQVKREGNVDLHRRLTTAVGKALG